MHGKSLLKMRARKSLLDLIDDAPSILMAVSTVGSRDAIFLLCPASIQVCRNDILCKSPGITPLLH